MKYAYLLLVMIVFDVRAEIVNGAVTVEQDKTVGLTATGSVNRDRTHDSASSLLLGIVKENENQVDSPEKLESNEIPTDLQLGDGFVIDDPAYMQQPK